METAKRAPFGHSTIGGLSAYPTKSRAMTSPFLIGCDEIQRAEDVFAHGFFGARRIPGRKRAKDQRVLRHRTLRSRGKDPERVVGGRRPYDADKTAQQR